jgi:transposase-like protein
MKTGVCPICNSTEVYMGTSRRKTVLNARNMIVINWKIHTLTQDYVCTDCGYTESYIEVAAALEKIRENWHRADGRPKDKHKNDE